MSGSVAVLERRLASLSARLAPPPTIGSPLELADRLGIRLDPWQREVATSPARQTLVNVTRQGGKSTVAALLGVHEALSRPGALVLVVSPGERQSKLLFKTLLDFYRRLGVPVPADAVNKLSLELANGSEVHALPGKEGTIRGFSAVTLLLADEASRIPDDLMGAVRPMLATSGGRLVAMSTPWGSRGWWWAAWSEGGPSWQRWEVPATACPRISADFLAEERRNLPPLVFDAEYSCTFAEADGSYFRRDDIAAALAPDLLPLELPEDWTWTQETTSGASPNPTPNRRPSSSV